MNRTIRTMTITAALVAVPVLAATPAAATGSPCPAGQTKTIVKNYNDQGIGYFCWTPPKDGKDGVDGKDGLPGKDGADGTGIQGLPGLPGAPGLPGVDGLPGAPGADGEDGLPGVGSDGKDGAAGPTGPAGATGKTGARGEATSSTGARGPAGPRGADGQTVIANADGTTTTVEDLPKTGGDATTLGLFLAGAAMVAAGTYVVVRRRRVA